jgi:flagellar basal body P-ring formation protein FlgA
MHKVLSLALVLAFVAEAALAQTVVPTRVIRAQSVIGPDDVTLLEAATPGAFAALGEAVGQEARVTLYPNRPVRPDQVGRPAIVERNQIVRMIFAQGSLNIAAEGRALDRAGPGEFVRVMNLNSRQVVTGLVRGSGLIEVGQ